VLINFDEARIAEARPRNAATAIKNNIDIRR
jgi:hypothetical protein